MCDKIIDCRKCLSCRATRRKTDDSWEEVYDYFCLATSDKDPREIETYVGWNELITPPAWCIKNTEVRKIAIPFAAMQEAFLYGRRYKESELKGVACMTDIQRELQLIAEKYHIDLLRI